MAAKKGTMPPNAGKGRPRGIPNKTTLATREAFQRLLDENQHNIEEWLKTVAADDPAAALRIIIDLAEFCIPKLGRTELTGKDGAQLLPGEDYDKKLAMIEKLIALRNAQRKHRAETADEPRHP